MSERFTEILRAASEPAWSHAVRHRFVNELFAGAVPDAVMARYLIQDHRFLDSFLTLLGATLASADTFEARVRFGRFIGMVSGEENTFFLRAFEALGVTENRRTADPDTQPTAGFKAIMREAAEGSRMYRWRKGDLNSRSPPRWRAHSARRFSRYLRRRHRRRTCYGSWSRNSGSHETRRWREMDSNPRSPVCGELGAPGPRATRPRAIVKPRNADRSRRQARRAICACLARLSLGQSRPRAGDRLRRPRASGGVPVPPSRQRSRSVGTIRFVAKAAAEIAVDSGIP